MTLDSYPTLGADGLTAVERNRKTIRDTLRAHLADTDDDLIWQITLAITENVPFMLPPVPTSLTYAWSNGLTFSTVDAGAVPDNGRERALLRALLAYALNEVDQHDMSLGIATIHEH